MMPLSLETRWAKFLTLKCYHDYYKDGACPDLKFVPTSDTELLMKNFRVLFRKQNDGCVLLYDTSQTLKMLNSPVLKSNVDKKMVFYIYNVNNHLSHITDMEFDKTDQVFYFSNIIKDKTKNADNIINSIPVDENKVIAKRKSFNVQFKDAAYTKDLVIKDDRGVVFTNKSLAAQDDKEKRSSHPIVLEYADEGRYHITSGKETQVLYCFGKGFNEKVWGVFEVFFNDEHNKLPIYTKDRILSPELSIKLKSRSTYWKYLLLSRFTDIEHISEVKITYEGKEMAFTPPKMVDLMSGGKATMIESKEGIKSSEFLFSNDTLSLKLKINGKWSSKMIALPKPSTDMLKPDRDTGKLYSVAYVYI